jgi:hypothetical protein
MLVNCQSKNNTLSLGFHSKLSSHSCQHRDRALNLYARKIYFNAKLCNHLEAKAQAFEVKAQEAKAQLNHE